MDLGRQVQRLVQGADLDALSGQPARKPPSLFEHRDDPTGGVRNRTEQRHRSRFPYDSGGLKGVVLAGGTGSRLYPLTRITNKHLLPIYDRPMITYAIEALVEAGVDEIMLVTGGIHAGEFFRLLGNGHEYGIERLLYAYQEKPGGIAEALGLAQRFAASDKVVVMLADNIFGQSIRTAIEGFRKQDSGARILLSQIQDPDHLRHLGVVRVRARDPHRPDRGETVGAAPARLRSPASTCTDARCST